MGDTFHNYFSPPAKFLPFNNFWHSFEKSLWQQLQWCYVTGKEWEAYCPGNDPVLCRWPAGAECEWNVNSKTHPIAQSESLWIVDICMEWPSMGYTVHRIYISICIWPHVATLPLNHTWLELDQSKCLAVNWWWAMITQTAGLPGKYSLQCSL